MTASDWEPIWQFGFVLFLAVPLLMMWAFAVVELFMRRDLSGTKKVLWLLAILFLPWMGTLLYYIFLLRDVRRPERATERPVLNDFAAGK